MITKDNIVEVAEALKECATQLAQFAKEQEEQPTSKFLNLEQASKFLNITKNALYHLTKRRELPFYKPNGGKIYFLIADLEQWLGTNRTKSRHEEYEDKAVKATIRKGVVL